jgi:threonine dehydrogenase-like Zn-dependent dehydrogenase
MNRNLTIRMGNCNHRKYMQQLIDLVRSGSLDPTRIVTRHETMPSILDAYKEFDTRQPGWLKVAINP